MNLKDNRLTNLFWMRIFIRKFYFYTFKEILLVICQSEIFANSEFTVFSKVCRLLFEKKG